MLTGMTERDWSIVLDVFDAAQSSRGEPGHDDRKFLEAVHYDAEHSEKDEPGCLRHPLSDEACSLPLRSDTEEKPPERALQPPGVADNLQPAPVGKRHLAPFLRNRDHHRVAQFREADGGPMPRAEHLRQALALGKGEESADPLDAIPTDERGAVVHRGRSQELLHDAALLERHLGLKLEAG